MAFSRTHYFLSAEKIKREYLSNSIEYHRAIIATILLPDTDYLFRLWSRLIKLHKINREIIHRDSKEILEDMLEESDKNFFSPYLNFKEHVNQDNVVHKYISIYQGDLAEVIRKRFPKKRFYKEFEHQLLESAVEAKVVKETPEPEIPIEFSLSIVKRDTEMLAKFLAGFFNKKYGFNTNWLSYAAVMWLGNVFEQVSLRKKGKLAERFLRYANILSTQQESEKRSLIFNDNTVKCLEKLIVYVLPERIYRLGFKIAEYNEEFDVGMIENMMAEASRIMGNINIGELKEVANSSVISYVDSH